jgi:hypothetical protein
MENLWSTQFAQESIFHFDNLSFAQQSELLEYLNNKFPPALYCEHRLLRKKAIDNLISGREVLSGIKQLYPRTIDAATVIASARDLEGYAIMLTAGGEGERLRRSLHAQGYSEDRLKDFTKATFPLPGFYGDLGALQINLCLIAHLCREQGLSVPVVVTTGPEGSVTAEVVPRILAEKGNFGLNQCRVIMQDERLHLTEGEQIAYTQTATGLRPVTNPDETGGPIMKLKKSDAAYSQSPMAWLQSKGCKKIILLQATALYEPELILKMAAVGNRFDGVGVGIARNVFPEDDPYGTYVLIEKEENKLIVVEKEVRNITTRKLQHPESGRFLPFNTGFYVFDLNIVFENDLPDYATPPKEVLPDIPRSPKIGYAATDIIGLAKNPAVLTVSDNAFAVIKNAGDLDRLSILGKSAGLDTICGEIMA